MEGIQRCPDLTPADIIPRMEIGIMSDWFSDIIPKPEVGNMTAFETVIIPIGIVTSYNIGIKTEKWTVIIPIIHHYDNGEILKIIQYFYFYTEKLSSAKPRMGHTGGESP